MRKKKIRCFKIYVSVVKDIYNYELKLPFGGDGYNSHTLATCMNCGELFVIDWDNPATEHLDIYEIAGKELCPTCGSLLQKSIANYPQTIRVSEGVFGSFDQEQSFGQPWSNETVEFYELWPPKQS
jgi:hypothetical protein